MSCIAASSYSSAFVASSLTSSYLTNKDKSQNVLPPIPVFFNDIPSGSVTGLQMTRMNNDPFTPLFEIQNNMIIDKNDLLVSMDEISYTSIHNFLLEIPSSLTLATTASTPPVLVDDILSTQDIFDGTILALALAFLASYLQGRTPSSSNIVLWSKDDGSNEFKDVYTSTSNKTQVITKDYEYSNIDNATTSKVFDGEKWKEISRPENYILYSTRVKQRLPNSETNPIGTKGGSKDKSKTSTTITNTISNKNVSTTTKQKDAKSSSPSSAPKEQKWVLLSLLVLFIPIFSIEFFFALSRQFICGDFVSIDSMDTTMKFGNTIGTTATSDLSPWARELCSAHLDR